MFGMEATQGLMKLAGLLVADNLLFGIVVVGRHLGGDDVLARGDPTAKMFYFLADDVDSEPVNEGTQFRLELEARQGEIEFDKDLRTDSDFFLSLNPKPCINERYAASSSTARFKAGRHQLKGGVYDLVVSDTTPEPVAMKEAFEVIEKMLNNIK